MNKFFPRSKYFFYLFLGLFLLFCSFTSTAKMDVDYRIKAQLDPAARTVSGFEVVEFRNDSGEAVDEFVFLLRANLHRKKNPYISGIQLDKRYPKGFDSGWTRIGSVKNSKGKALNYSFESMPPALQTYSLDKTLMRVSLEQPVEPGGKVRMRIEFETKFPLKATGDEEYYKGVFTWRFGWNPTLTPSSWWGKDGKSYWNQFELPAADYAGEFILPEDWSIVGASPLDDKVKRGKKVSVEMKDARSLPLVASKKFEVHSVDYGDFAIDVYGFPGYENEAKVLASDASRAIKYFSSKYGSLSKKRLNVVQNPVSGQFGMAADGMIILGDSVFSERNLLLSSMLERMMDYLVAHEVAHQWFGIGVGVDFNAENWMSEAFAEYLAVDYFEDKYGSQGGNLFRFPRSGFIRSMIESQLGFMNLRKHQFELPYIDNFRNGFDEAIIKPRSEVNYSQASNVRIYKKGYLVLRSLKAYFDPGEMNEFLSDLYEQKKDSRADVEDLRKIGRSISNEGMKGYFEDWLYSDGYLDLGVRNIESDRNGSVYENKIYLEREGKLPSPPVEILLTTEEGEELTEKTRIEGEEKVLQVTTETPVTKAYLDPKSRIMDVDRIDNHFPRKIELAIGKNKLPLDAYLIQLSTGGVAGSAVGRYNWVIGPGYARGQYDFGRNFSLSGNVRMRGRNFRNLNFQGSLRYRMKLWSHPSTGNPGNYWERAGSLDISLNRSLTELGKPFHYLGTKLALKERITGHWDLNASAALRPGKYGTLKIDAAEKVKVIPGFYLNGEIRLGMGTGEVPLPLKPRLDGLKSYGSYRKGGLLGSKWVEYDYPGDFKLASTLGLDVVMARDDNYYLGNLALIKKVTQSFWITGGETWGSVKEIGLGSLKAEVGTEFTVNLKTLGGALPIELSLGYAYHGEGKGRQFVNIGVNL